MKISIADSGSFFTYVFILGDKQAEESEDKDRGKGKSKRKRSTRLVIRPSALKQVSANEQDTTMSGYLMLRRKKDWKRQWYVLKEKVLYRYKASEDVAALESMPLLGYDVTNPTEVSFWHYLLI